MTGIIPVGLNPVRRGTALARDIAHADCQLVVVDSKSSATLGDIDHINVDSDEWAADVAGHRDAAISFQSASPDDLFMLMFTLGTSGDPKAVTCSHGKVAIAGVTMSDRFSLGPADVCYASMPLFHSNAVLVSWAVALACRGSMVLRRKFSASGFLPDIGRYGATYATKWASRCPMSLPHPSVRTTRTTPCGRSTAMKAHPLTSTGSGQIRLPGCRRLRVDRGRDRHWPHSGHPAGRAGSAARRGPDRRCRHRSAVPDRGGRGAGERQRRRPFRGLLQRPRSQRATASITVATSPIMTKPATPTSPAGSVTGCGPTVKTWQPHRSNGCCPATRTWARWRCTRCPIRPSATR